MPPAGDFSTFLKAGRNLPGKLRLRVVADQNGSSSSNGSDAQGTPTSQASASAHAAANGLSGQAAASPSGLQRDVVGVGPDAAEPAGAAPASSDHGNGSSSRATGGASTSGAAVPPRGPGRPGLGGFGRSSSITGHRLERFNRLLAAPVVDLAALRELSWSGIPHHLRPMCWRLLLGYVPPDKSLIARALKEERVKYTRMIAQLYDVPDAERSEAERAALRQVIVDAPRTAPSIPFFHYASVQKSLERLLYIWGIRHPASGYVQGMNDLVTPFYTVFLGEHLGDAAMEQWQPDKLAMNTMLDVEADCYWCLSKLIHGIQDQYTHAQPGIQRAVYRIHELVRLVDRKLAEKLEAEEVVYIQFAWRWINCLLLRELPFHLSLRLWDTYLAEDARMCDFLIYVCGSFLVHWSKDLMAMEFQDMIMFLQKPPTSDWDEAVLEVVLSRAFMWLNIWHDSTLLGEMKPEMMIQ